VARSTDALRSTETTRCCLPDTPSSNRTCINQLRTTVNNQKAGGFSLKSGINAAPHRVKHGLVLLALVLAHSTSQELYLGAVHSSAKASPGQHIFQPLHIFKGSSTPGAPSPSNAQPRLFDETVPGCTPNIAFPGDHMTVQIENFKLARQKLITADRLVILVITFALFVVQATWTVFLAWSGFQLIR